MEDFFGLIVFGVIFAISILSQRKRAQRQRQAREAAAREQTAKPQKAKAAAPQGATGQSLRDVLKQIANEFSEVPDAEALARQQAEQEQAVQQRQQRKQARKQRKKRAPEPSRPEAEDLEALKRQLAEKHGRAAAIAVPRSAPAVPALALRGANNATLRQAVIWSEVLGKPVSMRDE